MKSISVAYLHECLEYHQDSGELKWRERPRSHFRTHRGWRVFISKLAGKTAGTISRSTGYVVINFGNGNLFGAHRVAWAIANGEWPKGHIDHFNGVRSDNKLKNLRVCDRSENQCNRGVQSNNKSGRKGVHQHAPGVWRSRIQKHGHVVDLGLFPSPELAHDAYVVAAKKIHGDFACFD